MKKLLIALALFLLPLATARAGLIYSGADLSAGDGTMTITAMDGSTVLWELDLTRTGTSTRLSRFTDGGSFNYAAPAGLGNGLWRVGDNLGAYTEVARTADSYTFTLTGTASTYFDYTTTMTINMATAVGTHWTAARTITNNDPATARKPYSLANFDLNLAVGDYTPSAADAILGGTSGWADRYHESGVTGDDYLYLVHENVDRNATGLVTSETLRGEAVVLDTDATAALGMTPGLTFYAWSDITAYYPADSIGDANVIDGAAAYLRRLYIQGTPREFMGTSRAQHIALDPGASYTASYCLDINIASGSEIPEPASMVMLGLGVGGLILIRKRGR